MKSLESICVATKLNPEATILQCDCLDGLDNLKVIVFKGHHVTNPKSMQNCKSLKRMEIRYLKNCDEFWKNVIAPLERLELFNIKIGLAAWKLLIKNIKSSLKYLIIGKCTLKQAEFDEISELGNLESLTLTQMSHLSDEYFKFCCHLKKLKHLKIQVCNLKTDDCHYLNNLKNLTKLDMCDNSIDEVSFIYGMNEIRSLKMMDNYLRDEGCLLISLFSSITKLFLEGNGISTKNWFIFLK